MRYGKASSDLEAAMDESLRLYADGNPAFFDYLRDDVRVYSLGSAEPLIGRREFQAAFVGFADSKREVKVIHSDVQPNERQAVLAQTLEITVEDVTMFLRQTVVWERGDDGWQMSHIHNAQVGQPLTRLGALPASAAEVQVLNERIATVAATVGVAQ